MTKQQFSAIQTDQETLLGLYEGRDVETVQMICVDDDQYIESHRVSDWGVSAYEADDCVVSITNGRKRQFVRGAECQPLVREAFTHKRKPWSLVGVLCPDCGTSLGQEYKNWSEHPMLECNCGTLISIDKLTCKIAWQADPDE